MSNIRSKLINAKNMGMAAFSGAAALGVGYYNSFNNNKLSHTAKNMAEEAKNAAGQIVQVMPEVAANVTTIATEARQLAEDLYKASRVQGITLDVVLCLIALPSFLESCGHHAARNGLAWTQYLTQNWDYIIGRGFQMGGFAFMGKGIHEDGAGNPQFATAYVGAAPLAISVGTIFVERNRMKNASAPAAQQYQQPFLNEVHVDSASAPVQEGGDPQYQPPGYGNGRR